jgi:ATP-dependent protease Clp ATPase subunit/ribosomal protein L37AE/L43A
MENNGIKIETFMKKHQNCDTCGRQFRRGDVARYADGKFYCCQCDKDVQEDALMYLVCDRGFKLIMNKKLYSRLENGTYEVCKRNGRYIFNSKNPVGTGIREYMELVEEGEFQDREAEIYEEGEEGSYIIDKSDRAGLLIFPENKRLELCEFFDKVRDYHPIIAAMHECAGSNIHFIVDSTEVIGIAANFGAKRRWQEVHVELKLNAEIWTLKELELHHKVHFKERIRRKELKPVQLLEECEARIQGQGDELKKAVYMVYRYMKKVKDGTLTQADNWFLTAPSGSGKTEFYRTIKDVFHRYGIQIPVIQIDLSQITETGFKGENSDSIPRRILAEDTACGGVAICFLDESDKKFTPSFSSRDVNVNAAAQSNLLTLVEGIHKKIEIDGKNWDFDSSKTMFVFMGAFQDIRKNKQDEIQHQMGFMSEMKSEASVDECSDIFYEDISLQDMIDFGMQEELAGRIMQVVNFKPLSKTDMRKLIIRKTELISQELEINIHLTDKAVQSFLSISYGSLGVRRPMNLIKELALNCVSRVFFDEGYDYSRDKVIITDTETARIRKVKYNIKEHCVNF